MNKITQNSEASPADQGAVEIKPNEKSCGQKTITLDEAEYQKLLAQAAQYKDQYVRLYADFENARKRMERDRQDFVKYANEGIILEFLAILDNLQRSVEAAQVKHEDYAAFLKGVEMIMAQIHEMLKVNGVRAIETKNKMFDPHCHEILMQEESEKLAEGTILEEFQKGYMLGDRIIRTSKVKVVKKK